MGYTADEISIASGKPRELYKFEGTNADYFYTSNQEAVTYGGNSYAAVPIQRGKLNVGTQDDDGLDVSISMPVTLQLVTDYAFTIAPPRLFLTVYRYHNISDVVVAWKGPVTNIAVSRGKASVTCKSILSAALSAVCPSVQFQNPINKAEIINGIYIEEVPSSSGGVETISVLNAGFGYQFAPKITILGDGQSAAAFATINNNGSIKSITVTNPGTNYTSAIVAVTPQPGDTTGQLGAAVAKLEGQYGTLREYYNNTNNVKTVFNNNIGTVDYDAGIVTLNSFGPINVDNDLGQLTVSVTPTTTIVSSSFNRIITLDPFDPNAIVVNVTAKTA
jgi:hypothetical protein